MPDALQFIYRYKLGAIRWEKYNGDEEVKKRTKHIFDLLYTSICNQWWEEFEEAKRIFKKVV